MEIVKTVCARDCPDTCFIDVHIQDGRILRTRGSRENPVTQGFICPRGLGDKDRVYSPQRVLLPHLRPQDPAGAALEPTTWDAALDRTARELQRVLAQYGPESVLLYDYPGNEGFLAWQYPRRLWMALGAATTDYALCSNSGHAGIGLHYGLTHGLHTDELPGCKLLIYWGNNAKVSSRHHWTRVAKAQKRGQAKLVCVDPRQSETALASDLWIQLRPSSDVALCYGLARHLMLNNGVDREFISQWTAGYEAYAQEALSWSEKRLEELTGVSRQRIAELGDLLLESGRETAFLIGLGLQKSSQGAEAARAVSLLPALLGIHRGFRFSDSRCWSFDWAYLNGSGLAARTGPVVNQVSLGPKLAQGKYKFVFVLGSNPAVTLPDLQAVRAGLGSGDVFVAVQETHWTQTAHLADAVLPAPTYLEKRDLVFSDHHPYCRLSEKAIEPLGQSRHEIWVMTELARRLGRDEPWLYQDPWRELAHASRDSFVSGGLPELLAGKVLKLKAKPRREYQTPSGKIEFSSQSAAPLGACPLPRQEPLPGEDGWFVLLNSASAKYTHSQFTDVYGPIPALVWINPLDAAELGIGQGEEVCLRNESARVVLRAELTGKIGRGSLWAPRPCQGLNGEPLNALAPGQAQKIGGGPVFNSIRVKLQPVPGSSSI